ncbi:MAG: hypothetical protein JSU63_10220 [Phycisphaerales bacterium]|nr:MAG: hypothetical protein JSU63_10220 [Phycisphaerales bacterium]
MNRGIMQEHSLGSPAVRIVGTAVGAVAFCVYSRTWKDVWHIIYDIPAAVAVYSFCAQLLAEGLARRVDRWWWSRFIAVVAMSVITVGREFYSWPVSGHVSTVTAVALMQLRERRLPGAWRFAYLLPLPVLVSVRIFVFDVGLAAPLWTALLAGVGIGLGTVALGRAPAVLKDGERGDRAGEGEVSTGP